MSSAERARSPLAELPLDAAAIRERVVEAVAALDVSDSAVALALAPPGPAGFPVRWGLARGDERGAATLAASNDPATWKHAYRFRDVRLARPIETRTFRTIEQLLGREAVLRSKVWQTLYAPHRWVDQARVLICHGNQIVGLVIVLRSEGAPLIGSEELERLNGLVPSIRRALVAADGIEEAEREGPADLVLDASGRVDFASRAARPWLEKDGFLRELESLVRAADRGGLERGPVGPCAWANVVLTRIHGDAGVRYLANVTRLERATLSPSAVLTPAQLEVANLAAAGATAKEIAAMLGRSIETVRSHLRHVYRRLDISSRAELGRIVGGPHERDGPERR